MPPSKNENFLRKVNFLLFIWRYCDISQIIVRDITKEEVEKFLSENNFEYVPNQGAVSFPKLQRICTRLSQGKDLSSIKVADGKIMDGHHRFICSKLLGVKINIVPGAKNHTDVEYRWETMELHSIDYDTQDEIDNYVKEFDQE